MKSLAQKHSPGKQGFGRDLAKPAVALAAKSWGTPMVAGGEPWRLLDGDPNTFWSTPEPATYPADFGLEFGRAIEISGLSFVCPAPLSTGDLVPIAEQQDVQVWRKGKWVSISTIADKTSGTGRDAVICWRHIFKPVQTSRIRVVIKDGRQPRPMTHRIPPGVEPWVNDRPMAVQSLTVVSKKLEKSPRSLIWSSVQKEPRVLMVSAANDGDPDTYLPLMSCEAVGYEWPTPVRTNGVILRYNHFGFGEEEQIPELSEQVLEYWDGKEWQPLRALSVMDVSEREARAPMVHAGIVASAFCFSEVTCQRIRVRFLGARSRAALNGMEVYRSGKVRDYILGLSVADKGKGTVGGRELDLERDFAGVIGDETHGGQTDWMKLGKVDGHLMEVKGFDQSLTSRKGAEIGHLTDGRMDTWWSPAKGLPIEIGAEWHEPVLVGRVEVVYRVEQGRRYEPAYDGQALQYLDGRQWQTLSTEPEVDESAVEKGYTTWTYRVFPTAASRFRLVISKLHASCRGPDTVRMIRLAMVEDVSRAHRDWMCSARPDPYGKWILHGGKEPSYESVSAHILSPIMRAPVGFRSKQSLGKVRETAESAVSWEGTVLTPWPHGLGGAAFRGRTSLNWFVGFAFGSKPRLQGIPSRAIRRHLIDGYLPGIEFIHYHEGLVYRQTVFACEVGGKGLQGKIANWMRVEVENPGKEKRKTQVKVVTGCHLGYPNRPVPVASRYDGTQRWLMEAHGNSRLLWHSEGGVFQDGLEKIVTYELILKPGERRVIEVRQPLFACGEADGKRVEEMEFNEALAHFRRNWNEVLETGMRIETPEERVNRVYRASLTQVMLGDHGGEPAYGLWPSHYYRALWGLDSSLNPRALAEYGYPEIARCEFDHCLIPMYRLRWTHIKDFNLASTLGDHGWLPHYVIQVGRVMRDRDWLRRMTPFLRECAEWTRAERRKMLNATGPHRGLIPKHVYGGDIKDPAYSFMQMAPLWRGLRDTGYILPELGDRENGEIYLKEAAEFKDLLLRLMRKSRLTCQKPSTVSTVLYWPMPYEFSPTHYQAYLPILLETDIVPVEEAEEYADWLVADGRTFCGVQRIWTGMALDRSRQQREYSACVESVYGLGYQWTYLKRDRIVDFLLGFYGSMAVNMDRDVFTAGESNELGVAEDDRMIYSKMTHNRRDNNWMGASDPCTSPPAVFLIMLRQMLVMEEDDAEGCDTGVLWLNRAAPRRWFEDGQRIAVERAPLKNGQISFQVISQAKRSMICAKIDGSKLAGVREIRLRLRHPANRRLKTVTVDGKTIESFDAEREIVVLKGETGVVSVEAYY